MSPSNNFLEEYKRAPAPVNTQLHSNREADVQNNRNNPTIIVDTTKICSRRNLPVKGHSDSVKEQSKVYPSQRAFVILLNCFIIVLVGVIPI